MPPHLALSAETQRALILLLPLAATILTVILRRPGTRLLTGAFFAALWNFSTLLPVNMLAVRMGWWSFHTKHALLLGLPWDILLGWAVWWGGGIFLITQGRHGMLAVTGAFWLDLLMMPQLAPVIVLGKQWLWGECLVLAACFVPGWLLAWATWRDRHVGWRAAMLALVTGLMATGLLPAILLEHSHRHLQDIFQKPRWLISLAGNALLLPVILGLAGSQEFAERGKGTPIPFDPPKILVTTGPYAYVANPMQISFVLMLAILSILYQNAAIACAAIMAVIYCLGVVQWHHGIDIIPRFGLSFIEYRRHVRDWLPRWKPWIDQPAKVYFARHCHICHDTENWLRRLHPLQLEILDISAHPNAIDRVTYRYPNGQEVHGIYAIASCLNHINVVYAFLGWFMRLPVVRQFLQILIDGTGERAKPFRLLLCFAPVLLSSA